MTDRAARTEHDQGLARLLGLLIALPVVNALADPSLSQVVGALVGGVALAAHLVSVSGRREVAGRVAALALAALTVSCGVAGHALTGQPWTLVVVAAAVQCAVRLAPLPAAIAGVLGCTAAAPLAGRTDDLSTTLVLVAGPGLIAALRHRLLVTITELRDTREQLAYAAVRRERDRFSDDLHDVLGHSLSVIAVSAQVVRRVAATDPVRAAEVGAEIETHARRALDDVRATVHGYRDRTLLDEAEELRRALTTAGIAADIDLGTAAEAGLDLDATIDAALALVLREAVTNVVRHSRAARCRVRLWHEDGTLQLRVSDDGRGDDAAVARAERGLSTVRARLAPLSGRVTVRAETPHGFRLDAALPVGRSS